MRTRTVRAPRDAGSGAAGRSGLDTSIAGDTQPLLQKRAGRRVLQMHLLARLQMLANAKSRERGFMETRKDQFFLSRIIVDVADRKDPGNTRLEARRVDGIVLRFSASPRSAIGPSFGSSPQKISS